ncbi:MAG: magnesium transporter CorA family protein [Crocinitomicaceae bacterium]
MNEDCIMMTFYTNNKGLVASDSFELNGWINVISPSPEERKYLLDEIKLPEAFYSDIEDVDERPRIEIEDDWSLFILRIPVKTNDVKLPFITVPLGIIFKDQIFVTICFHSTDILNDFVSYSTRKNIRIQNDFEMVLRILLSSSIWYLKYLKQINQLIKLAETNLEKSIKNEDLQTLLQIEKCLVFFMTSLKGNDILFHRLKMIKSQRENYDEDLIEDVDIEIRQAQETTSIYSNILSGMMDAYASVISNNLNIIMKRLTSISILIMIPTLVASLYGMNIPNGLEDSKHSFIGIIAVSLVLSLFGAIMFKRKNLF